MNIDARWLHAKTVHTTRDGNTFAMSTSTDAGVAVSDDPEQSRYVATLDGSQVGFAEYRLDGSTIVFTHTEVDDAAEGKGVGSTLARTALDEARDRGLRVVPRCRFIAAFIARHDEYLELVDDENRKLVDRAAD
jgi:predicted GNAT family acetyltransferase